VSEIPFCEDKVRKEKGRKKEKVVRVGRKKGLIIMMYEYRQGCKVYKYQDEVHGFPLLHWELVMKGKNVHYTTLLTWHDH